jgi:hypothetical protein
MIKTTLSLLICFSGLVIKAQSINNRVVDSLGDIIISTTTDTIAMSPMYCFTEGVVYNSDSVNHYVLVFYFNAPHTFFLNTNDKIQIRYNDGEVYEELVYTDGEFFTEGKSVKITLLITKNVLKKMLRNSVLSISLITEKLRHTIKVEEAYNQSFKKLSAYMLNINVYDENGTMRSELNK